MLVRVLLFALWISCSLTAWGQTTKEMVVVSGGPALRFFERAKEHSHDHYWFNFIDASEIRIKQIQPTLQPGAAITWLVYRPAYQSRGFEMNVDLLQLIVDKANAMGVPLLWFDTKEELINYLNYGKDRSKIPLGGFEYFGHSNKACLMFDYSSEYDAQSRVFLHVNDLKDIKADIFSADAVVQSWGCHSGEYYSVEWQKRFQVPMIGAIGKTDYSHLGSLPFLSDPTGRWSNGTN